jgi:hypothetical protein
MRRIHPPAENEKQQREKIILALLFFAAPS